MEPIGYTETSVTTILGCVTSQKSEDLLRILYLREKDIILKAIYRNLWVNDIMLTDVL